MLELERRESQMLGGLWLQILVIGVMVFAYTQAIRQLNHRKELTTRLQEQLTIAREELAREGSRPDTSGLQREVVQLESAFFSRDLIEQWLPLFKTIAQDQFSIQDLKIQLAASPAQKLEVSFQDQQNLVMELYSLTLTGVGSSRNVAGLLASISRENLRPFCPLNKMSLQAQALTEIQPVKLHLEWWVVAQGSAESDEGQERQPGQNPFSLLELSKGSSPAWGARAEPFLSPFIRLSALGKREIGREKFKLTGIIWDSVQPTCVINEVVMKLGDRIGEYTLVLVTPTVVLLQKEDEELLIPLS